VTSRWRSTDWCSTKGSNFSGSWTWKTIIHLSVQTSTIVPGAAARSYRWWHDSQVDTPVIPGVDRRMRYSPLYISRFHQGWLHAIRLLLINSKETKKRIVVPSWTYPCPCPANVRVVRPHCLDAKLWPLAQNLSAPGGDGSRRGGSFETGTSAWTAVAHNARQVFKSGGKWMRQYA
jgi:hypothetical protein